MHFNCVEVFKNRGNLDSLCFLPTCNVSKLPFRSLSFVCFIYGPLLLYAEMCLTHWSEIVPI